MINYAQSYLVLLVQKIHRVFCFYNTSPKTIEAFENVHGINSWNNYKTNLTLYYIDNNIRTEKITILTPPFNNNWYFDIEGDDVTAYVELSKVTFDNHHEKILTSNIVTTPRDQISKDSNFFIDAMRNQNFTELNSSKASL